MQKKTAGGIGLKLDSFLISCALGLAQSCVNSAQQALSSAHQRERASGIVDENFPYWISGYEEPEQGLKYLSPCTIHIFTSDAFPK